MTPLTGLMPSPRCSRPLLPPPVLMPPPFVALLLSSLLDSPGVPPLPCCSAGCIIPHRMSLSSFGAFILMLPHIPSLPALRKPPLLSSPLPPSVPTCVSVRLKAQPLASLGGQNPFFSR
jgi:hypothetical protein